MSRDKQSLEEIKSYDDSYWLRYLAENTIFDTENIKAQKDWLIKQLEAEKERADGLQTELSKYTEANLKAFEREKKLAEALKNVRTITRGSAAFTEAAYAHREAHKALISLYPKEETK